VKFEGVSRRNVKIINNLHSMYSPDSWLGLHIYRFFFLFTGNEEKPSEKIWALLGHTPCGLGLKSKLSVSILQ